MDGIIQILQGARKAKNLTQGQLGAKAGLPQSHISQIEAGKIDLRLSSLQEIARLLDLDVMLVPVNLKPAIRSIISGKESDIRKPAWQVDEEEHE